MQSWSNFDCCGIKTISLNRHAFLITILIEILANRLSIGGGQKIQVITTGSGRKWLTVASRLWKVNIVFGVWSVWARRCASCWSLGVGVVVRANDMVTSGHTAAVARTTSTDAILLIIANVVGRRFVCQLLNESYIHYWMWSDNRAQYLCHCRWFVWLGHWGTLS